MGVVYQWLQSGKHSFESVVIDSLSELQKRCQDNIAGNEPMKQQDWGELLRKMENLARAFRDLTFPNGTPGLQAMVMVSSEVHKEDDGYRPALQGQFGQSLPHLMDVVGRLTVQEDENGDYVRKMKLVPEGCVAKDRTNRLDQIIYNPNITEIMEVLNNG